MPRTDCDYLTKIIHFLCNKEQWPPLITNDKTSLDNKNNNLHKIFENLTNADYGRFIHYLALSSVKDYLLDCRSVIKTMVMAKLFAQAKDYNSLPNVTCMTTDQANDLAPNLVVRWAIIETLFGQTLIASLNNNICAIFFVEKYGLAGALMRLQKQWPGVHIQHDQSITQLFVPVLQKIFRGDKNQHPQVILKGTEFQFIIWKTLMCIPDGLVLSYGDLASLSGYTKAYRAVGTAVGQNPIAYLIPCHRVIKASGALGQYHWGREQKQVMLAMERARCKH